MRGSHTLIVGIGSPHGDDQAGWRVVQSLTSANIGDAEVWTARSPVEILDRLESVDRLILCDACRGNDPLGTIRQWRWPAPELQRLAWPGTHDLGLCNVLELAGELGQLPGDVILWSIEAGPTDPDAPISAEVEAAAGIVAKRIRHELRHKTTVAKTGVGDA